MHLARITHSCAAPAPKAAAVAGLARSAASPTRAAATVTARAPRALVVTLVSSLALGAGLGCKDQGKESVAKATAHVSSLVAVAEKDVGEVERGVPEGAKRLSALWTAGGSVGGDPRNDAPAARMALKRIRRDVPDLAVAKSTFFALTDEKGIAIRNDLEQDVMAGQNLVTIFPELARAQRGEYVTTSGSFPGVTGPAGPDRDWIAASPVKRDDGAVAGLFVTGWSYRYFARHLQEQLLKDVKEALLKTSDSGKVPILYVAVFDKSGVYSAPLTPPVNEKALVDEGLVGKTANGPYQAVVNITGRDFGCAASRVPKLGAEIGIVVLRSEI